MGEKIHNIVVGFLGLLTIFDMYTSYQGTMVILGSGVDENHARGVSFILAFGVGSMLIKTVSVFEYGRYNGKFGAMLIMTWWIFFIYDIFTSWKGILNLMYGSHTSLNVEQMIILGGTTVFVSISAIIISNIVADR